jgi:hypothetical protein
VWSGEVSPSEATDYEIVVTNIDTASCISGNTETTIVYDPDYELCGTPNADPTMFLTLSWTDEDETKSWGGCTWNNGETKEVYGNYEYIPFSEDYCAASDSQEEGWAAWGGTINKVGGSCGSVDFSVYTSNESLSGCVTRLVDIAVGGNEAQIVQCLYATNEIGCDTLSSVDTHTPDSFNGLEVNDPCDAGEDCATNCPGGYLENGYINNRLTDGSHLAGSITFTDGITVSWAQGNGW